MSDLQFEIGDIVSVENDKTGTVKYIGPTHFRPGIWVGVELDSDNGKNDGTVQGVFYFPCVPNKGLFVLPNKVKLIRKGKRGEKGRTRSSSTTEKSAIPRLPHPTKNLSATTSSSTNQTTMIDPTGLFSSPKFNTKMKNGTMQKSTSQTNMNELAKKYVPSVESDIKKENDLLKKKIELMEENMSQEISQYKKQLTETTQKYKESKEKVEQMEIQISIAEAEKNLKREQNQGENVDELLIVENEKLKREIKNLKKRTDGSMFNQILEELSLQLSEATKERDLALDKNKKAEEMMMKQAELLRKQMDENRRSHDAEKEEMQVKLEKLSHEYEYVKGMLQQQIDIKSSQEDEFMKSKLVELDEKCGILEVERNMLQNENAELQKDLINFKMQTENIVSSLNLNTLEDLGTLFYKKTKEVDDLNVKIYELDEENSKYAATLQEYTQENNKLKKRIEEMSNERPEGIPTEEKLKKDEYLNTLNEQINSLRQQIANLEAGKDDLTVKNNELISLCEEMTLKIDERDTEIEILKLESSNKDEGKIEELSKIIKLAEDSKNQLTKEVEKKNEEIKALNLEISERQSQQNEKIEAELREKENQLNILGLEINLLKEKLKLEEDEKSQLTDQVADLKSEVEVLNESLAIEKEIKIEIEKENKALINDRGALKLKFDESLIQIEATRKDLENLKLEKDSKDFDEQMHQLKEQFEAKEKEYEIKLEELKSKIAESNTEYEKLELMKKEQEKEIRNISSELEVALTKELNLENELIEKETNLKIMNDKLAEIEKYSEDLKNSKERAEMQIFQLEKDNEKVHKENEELQVEKESLTKAMNLNLDIQAASHQQSNEVEELYQKVDHLTQQLAAEISHSSSKISALEKQIKHYIQLETQLKQSESQKSELKDRVELLLEEKERLEKEISSLYNEKAVPGKFIKRPLLNSMASGFDLNALSEQDLVQKVADMEKDLASIESTFVVPVIKDPKLMSSILQKYPVLKRLVDSSINGPTDENQIFELVERQLNEEKDELEHLKSMLERKVIKEIELEDTIALKVAELNALRSSQQKNRLFCAICQELDHAEDECPKLQLKIESFCENCEEFGHSTEECESVNQVNHHTNRSSSS